MTKVALYGFGNMNKITLTFLKEKGYEVVAVIGSRDQIGKDAGEVAGVESIGVLVSDRQDAEKILKDTKPDVAIVATKSFLRDLIEPLRICGACGVNCITIGEEVCNSWKTEPSMTAELDRLYRDNGVSLIGTGYQDAYWVYLPALLAGVSVNTKKLVCHTQYNVDDYGSALYEAHGVGLTPQEFKAKFIPEEAPPAYVWNSNEALVLRLGYKILKTTQSFEPMLPGKDIVSRGYGPISNGRVTGLKAIVKTLGEKPNGQIVEVETHCIGQVYYDNLEDYNQWELFGTPNLEIVCKRPDTARITCASAVNRITSVLSARSGYVALHELEPLA